MPVILVKCSRREFLFATNYTDLYESLVYYIWSDCLWEAVLQPVFLFATDYTDYTNVFCFAEWDHDDRDGRFEGDWSTINFKL
jgi:hypothetical protein